LVDIRFLRLDDDVCTLLNDLARERRRNVSDLANEFLRKQLGTENLQMPERPAPHAGTD